MADTLYCDKSFTKFNLTNHTRYPLGSSGWTYRYVQYTQHVQHGCRFMRKYVRMYIYTYTEVVAVDTLWPVSWSSLVYLLLPHVRIMKLQATYKVWYSLSTQ